MSELPDATRLLEAAEQAARTDDLALADELLRRAAHLQEIELGPLHPDLANTLNNLAIVAEKTGRLSEAETFYRRAVAITSASLPADHPMVTASRENLEDFCRARGLPIEKPAEVHPVDAVFIPEATPQPSIAPLPVPEQRTPSAPEPLLSGSRRVSRSLVWAAIGVVVVATATFLLMRRPPSSRETPTTDRRRNSRPSRRAPSVRYRYAPSRLLRPVRSNTRNRRRLSRRARIEAAPGARPLVGRPLRAPSRWPRRNSVGPFRSPARPGDAIR